MHDIRLGEFEVDVPAAEFRRGGRRIWLLDPRLQILLMLLQCLGVALTGEGMRRRARARVG